MNYFNNNNTLSESNNLDVNSSINYISSQISEDDFKYLNLKYIEGYNYSEIGDFFNVTSSTVSNRVNYIKTKLKKNNKEIIFD
jgi:DNA-directed RNA polymerase specialized sigma24 family protein